LLVLWLISSQPPTKKQQQQQQQPSGSYASVFRATRSDGKDIAVKEFSGKGIRRHARNEAIVLCALSEHGDCENVVRFMGWRKTDEGLYQLGLELCDRGNLYSAMNTKSGRNTSKRRGEADPVLLELQQNRAKIIRGLVSAMTHVHRFVFCVIPFSPILFF
jgi:hypothetical protein